MSRFFFLNLLFCIVVLIAASAHEMYLMFGALAAQVFCFLMQIAED